ncbi:MAG: LpxI family protein [Candidatus Omnitrophota bacterium]|jgi:DUF1009 family protein|nr:MAG: LpxI family protein [Candidatus Omnitrophota bacterium]
MERIGLIAGNRKFPIIFSEAARKKGYEIVAIAIKGDTSAKINQLADKVYWLKLSDFSRVFDILNYEGVKKILMAGQISPWRLFSKEVQKDKSLKEILDSLADKRADTIFGAIADKFSERGFEILDSTSLIEEQLPKKGTLTKKQPDFKGWEDVYFGFELAKKVAFLDIGQTVAVKQKAIVAIEALEGTDKLIKRAGKIARGGITIVKVSKPKQDKRFDIPVVGLSTIKNLIKARAQCLAIEAGKTLFIDKEISLAFADRHGLAIVAV